MKRRKGSLLVVITYGSLMAVVVLGMMTLASSLYSTARDSAKTYSDVQTYRSACEMACYEYVTELEAVTVTKNLDADWISVTGNAIYTQAIDAILESIGSAEDPNVWRVYDIRDALRMANISDPSILVGLFAKLDGVSQEFCLKVVEPPRLDWENEDSWKRSGDAHIAIEPVIIEINFRVKGEELFERFRVNGLFLEVQSSDMDVGGSRNEIATLMLVEKEEGVSITREFS